MLLGYLSFDMISDAMIRHAGADNLELVKQNNQKYWDSNDRIWRYFKRNSYQWKLLTGL